LTFSVNAYNAYRPEACAAATSDRTGNALSRARRITRALP
jgi:hypothetical protein